MADSRSTSHTTSAATSVNIKRKRKTRGAKMYTMVKNTHENYGYYLVIVDVATCRAYCENDEDFMGYIVLHGRSKVIIFIDSWHDVDDELKNN
ncbi:unnamed protein product [Lathyrus oleraceus]